MIIVVILLVLSALVVVGGVIYNVHPRTKSIKPSLIYSGDIGDMKDADAYMEKLVAADDVLEDFASQIYINAKTRSKKLCGYRVSVFGLVAVTVFLFVLAAIIQRELRCKR